MEAVAVVTGGDGTKHGGPALATDQHLAGHRPAAGEGHAGQVASQHQQVARTPFSARRLKGCPRGQYCRCTIHRGAGER